ncbi:3-hexulose-6-phosphate synthase [Propionicimonas sp. T2.31MG-18]
MDIVEVGTPLLMRYGVDIITEIKAKHPAIKLLSDAKIMDAAHDEAAMSFDAGADYVTILALTDDGSVREAVRAARERPGTKVVADMICVRELPVRARELAALGVDMLAVHTGVDQQALGRSPLDDLRELTAAGTGLCLAVAGGIRAATLAQYLHYRPQVVIVGSGIISAPDPVAEAWQIHQLVRGVAI